MQNLLGSLRTENTQLQERVRILEGEMTLNYKQLWNLQHERERQLQDVGSQLDEKERQLELQDEELQIILQSNHSLEV